MFTIVSIKSNVTIGRLVPPTSPAVRLDERGIRVDGVRPLDLAPGETTRVFYPLVDGGELACAVTREFVMADIVAADEELAKHADGGREALRDAFTPSADVVAFLTKDETETTGFSLIRAKEENAERKTPGSLAATIERARKAGESNPSPRRGGRRSAKGSAS